MQPFGRLGKKLGSSILVCLFAVQGCFAKAGEKGITVVKTGGISARNKKGLRSTETPGPWKPLNYGG